MILLIFLPSTVFNIRHDFMTLWFLARNDDGIRQLKFHESPPLARGVILVPSVSRLKFRYGNLFFHRGWVWPQINFLQANYFTEHDWTSENIYIFTLQCLINGRVQIVEGGGKNLEQLTHPRSQRNDWLLRRLAARQTLAREYTTNKQGVPNDK